MLSFKLPDLGEGLQEAEIVEWKVSVGDKVELDQLVLVVETAKAIVEIPSPVETVIEELCVAQGDTVDVGVVLFRYKGVKQHEESGGGLEEAPVTFESGRDKLTKTRSVSVVGQLQESAEEQSCNVYEGVVAESALEEPQRQQFNLQKNRRDADSRQNATPAIHAFARKLGLHHRLEEHQYGELSEHELLQMYEKMNDENAGDSDVCKHILKLSGARKVMAQSMTKSHQHIPSVTLFDEADITHWNEKTDITVRVVESLIAACKKVPLLNAWFDEEALSVQMFDDIHLGVAVNSNDGLFVPVIRAVQDLSSERIREILNRHVEQVENRSIKPQKLLGATISLSNFGTLSGRYATPIIVPPQVAIVGVGKVSKQAVVRNDELAIGRVMPLSLSFDHRAASGADAASFLNEMIACLER